MSITISFLVLFLLHMKESIANTQYSYRNDEFPHLLGQITMNEYNLANHVLRNNNMFTIREIDAMMIHPDEAYFE